MMNKFNPDYAIHVGQFLKNALNAYDMKQAELAEKIGVSKSVINEIIKGKRNINAAFALKLEPIFDMPASYWMELQTQFDIAVAKAGTARHSTRHRASSSARTDFKFFISVSSSIMNLSPRLRMHRTDSEWVFFRPGRLRAHNKPDYCSTGFSKKQGLFR